MHLRDAGHAWHTNEAAVAQLHARRRLVCTSVARTTGIEAGCGWIVEGEAGTGVVAEGWVAQGIGVVLGVVPIPGSGAVSGEGATNGATNGN